MVSLENIDDAVLSYADALGVVEPKAVAKGEEGKVELSVPMKYVPKPKAPKQKPKPKNPPLPKGEAVAVFSHETYVDDEGIEHMVPPTYDKSKMNLPKAKFQKPTDMPEVINADDVSEDAEIPSFLQNWQDENDVDKIDSQINQFLDDDMPLDFAPAKNEKDDKSLDEVSFLQKNLSSFRGTGGFSSASLLKEFAKPQNVAPENEGLDNGNFDSAVAAHISVSEKPALKESTGNAVMLDENLSQHDENVPHSISLVEEEEKGLLSEEISSENDVVEEPVFVVEPEAEDVSVVTSEVETIEPQVKVDNMGRSFVEEPVENATVEHIVLPAEPDDNAIEMQIKPADESQSLFGENKFAQEYSLGLSDSYKVISAQDMPQSFNGDDAVNAIQINVGESDYGWSVIFDNGIVMGISDVRRYQLQFGALPSMNGVVAYGKQKMGFTKIKKIVLYQTAKYFKYTL